MMNSTGWTMEGKDFYDTAGQPLSPTSPSTLLFRLYRQAVGGIAIWEEPQPNMSVTAGRFNYIIKY